ncbi:MAG: hypothetical protein IKG47_12395 [Oscillospiraceae bacterium]|nr:hypothetical protein [Oscillospiraceae bacterium]
MIKRLIKWYINIKHSALIESARAYSQEHYVRMPDIRYSLSDASISKFMETLKEEKTADAVSKQSVQIKNELERITEPTFVDMLLNLVNQKGIKDADVYHAAQVDRRLYSKIISDRSYKPSKDTCAALCFALRLSKNEALELLSKAGYTLSHSYVRDLMLEYFFEEKIYDINKINELLYYLDQKPLGRNVY